MTSAVLDRPGSACEGVARVVGGRGLTLEERLSEVQRAAHTAAGASCPVCGAQMSAADGDAAACDGCGSRLT